MRRTDAACRTDFTAKSVADVASQTQAISLLIAASHASSSLSPAALDSNCSSQEDVFSSSAECSVSAERVGDARAALKPLDNLSERTENGTSIRLTKAYIQLAIGDTQQCITTLSTVDFDTERKPVQTIPPSSSAPASAASSLGTSSGISTLESALSRSGTLAGSIGVTNLGKRLDVEVGDGKVWATVERLRGRCLEGEYPKCPLLLPHLILNLLTRHGIRASSGSRIGSHGV